MKKMVLVICVFVLSCFGCITIHADEEIYTIYDYETDAAVLDPFDSFHGAFEAFQEHKEEYGNLAILRDDRVLVVENGIVTFHTDDACEYSISYKQVSDGKTGYLNGCYGIDGAYVSTDEDGKRVTFLVSGVTGAASLEDVDIVPLEKLDVTTSLYTVEQGNLYHEIKTQMQTDAFSYIIQLGEKPEFMDEGTYYSYDGHYFYHSLKDLTEDLAHETHESAINEMPYYNYYQFLPHRTLTAYNASEVEAYLENTLGIRGAMDSYNDADVNGEDDTVTRSQLYGMMDAFWQYQYQYGTNALMMLAQSIMESSYGRNVRSYMGNHLFASAAYDEDMQMEEDRFLTLNDSVYAHAKYMISGTYCSPLKDVYHGSFFGNRSGGMNVSCSDDPYWGEKCAQYYAQLDTALGRKDFNHHQLAVKNNTMQCAVYRNPNKNEGALYYTPAEKDYTVVVLDDSDEDYYMIQSDSTLMEDLTDISYYYDFEEDIGYVRKDEFDLVNDGQMQMDSFKEVSFALDEDVITYKLPENQEEVCIVPEKQGYLFDRWNQKEDGYYEAEMKEVDSVSITSYPLREYERNDRISLKRGKVRVVMKDGTELEDSLTTSMISNFNMSKDGDQQVNVNYFGNETSYDISISAEQNAYRNDKKTQIEEMIETYKDKGVLTGDERSSILLFKQEIDATFLPYLTQNQLRQFDRIVHKAIGDGIGYTVSENDRYFGISGLSLSMPLGNSLDKNVYHRDFYSASVLDNPEDKDLQKIIEGQNYIYDSSFTITLTKNGETVLPSNPLVCSIAKPADTEENVIFRLFHLDVDGDVEMCYTRQSENRISFMIEQPGTYAVGYRRTSSVYYADDPVETVTFETSDEEIEDPLTWYGYVALGSTGLILLALLIRRLLVQRKIRRKNKERQLEVDRMMEETRMIDIRWEETMAMRIIREEEQDDQQDSEY
ncbi:MAG: glucosaminidase domain-containing protein [Solobacterium sp.]|nr:glucosaminidase domain-containing protein [Solobacterium sp.]